MRRAAILAWLVLLALPAGASAHASLKSATPSRGEVVAAQPDAVVFEFTEPIESRFGAVKVFDSRGERVDEGPVFRPLGSESVAVALRDRLSDGTYTATYRVISADSHPVTGGMVFSVGEAGIATRSVAELIAEGDTGPVTRLATAAARWLSYAAIALAVGGLLFLGAVWNRAASAVAGPDPAWHDATGAFERRARRLLGAAAVTGIIGGTLGIVLQGATAAGSSFWAALDVRTVGSVLDTRFGAVWGVAVFAWLVFGASLLVSRDRPVAAVLRPAALGATGSARAPRLAGRRLAFLGAPLVLVAIAPGLAGHAASGELALLLLPTDVAHVIAMSIWLGGLAFAVLAVPAATRRLPAADRTRLLAAALVRFSPLALTSVAVLLGTGLLQAYVHVRSPDNLIDTAFGRAVLVKAGLLLALIALGAVNRRRALPRLSALADQGAAPGSAGRLLRRALRAEAGLLAVVLAVTAALVSYPPSTSAGSGPVSTSRSVGPALLDLTVDPARLGRNEMHLYFFDARDGSQFEGAEELQVQLALPDRDVGPLDVDARRAGPGHYVAGDVTLAIPGEWRIDVVLRVSEFEQHTATVPVTIR